MNEEQQAIYNKLKTLIFRVSGKINAKQLQKTILDYAPADLNTLAFLYYGQDLNDLVEFEDMDNYDNIDEFDDMVRSYGARVWKEHYNYAVLGPSRGKHTGFGAVMNNGRDPYFVWLVDFEFAATKMWAEGEEAELLW